VSAAVIASSVAATQPLAGATPGAPDTPAQAEPEPLELDREQDLVEQAVVEAEAAVEAESDALEVPLPAGAMDGTAGADLFSEEDPSVLRPGEDGAELQQLAEAGYRRVGDYMVPPL
jgi:hypothetical protein